MPRFASVALSWALPITVAMVSCNDGDSTDLPDRPAPPTSVILSPSAFLGGVACGDVDGSLSHYQVTLFDLGKAEDWKADVEPSPLPSSPVVSCRQDVSFLGVEPGHLYTGQVQAFNQLDVRAKTKGDSVVVDSAGNEVVPAWTTTCWGYDGLDYGSAFGGAGGAQGGSEPSLLPGVLSYLDTEVFLGGCEPLTGEFPEELTGLSLDITHALGGLSCGGESGEVDRFRVILPEDESSAEEMDAGVGGMGGSGGPGGSSAMGGQGGQAGSGGDPPIEREEFSCGRVAVRTGLQAGQLVTFQVLAYEAENASPTWSASCRAVVRKGVVSPASCDPLATVP